MPADSAHPAPEPLIRFDPGWLFLIAGVAVLAATVLIPASHDLALARWQRDRAVAIERHRQDRLERYGSYLSALARNDESVVLSLAATQLHRSPVDRIPLQPVADPSLTSASVFPTLEPPPLRLPPKPVVGGEGRGSEPDSLLARWTTHETYRLWLLAGGALCVLLGLLPASRATPAP